MRRMVGTLTHQVDWMRFETLFAHPCPMLLGEHGTYVRLKRAAMASITSTQRPRYVVVPFTMKS